MAEQGVQPTGTLPTPEERQWAMLAHLSILLNLLTGLGGPVAALLIYLVYRERSRYVAFHALQSLVFQLIAWVGGGALAAILAALATLLTAVVIGLFLWPVACLVGLVPLAALGYGIIAGVACSRGEDFRYWLVGDWVANTFVETTGTGAGSR